MSLSIKIGTVLIIQRANYFALHVTRVGAMHILLNCDTNFQPNFMKFTVIIIASPEYHTNS